MASFDAQLTAIVTKEHVFSVRHFPASRSRLHLFQTTGLALTNARRLLFRIWLLHSTTQRSAKDERTNEWTDASWPWIESLSTQSRSRRSISWARLMKAAGVVPDSSKCGRHIDTNLDSTVAQMRRRRADGRTDGDGEGGQHRGWWRYARVLRAAGSLKFVVITTSPV